jgi:hypothetical protein
MANAFQDLEDQQEAQNIDLSENVVADYIEYHRGSVVGHEEEGVLMWLSLLTGYIADDGIHVNCVGIGPPGSGKSLTKNTVEEVLPSRDTFVKTDASDNALLDSVAWDCSICAPLDEYDKLSGAIREYLKSMNSEDGGYTKTRNVEDPDSPTGYSPTEVSSDAIPWTILYAPTSKKGGIDDELEDRALILYFSNTKRTRRGIGRKEWGHDNITPTEESAYIYDNHELGVALRDHIRSLPVETEYEYIEGDDDDEDRQLVGRHGDVYVYTPQWCWYAVEPIFDTDSDHTNRVYGIVHDCVAASAIVNRGHRTRKEVDIYVSEDSAETEARQAVVVDAQDVANVLSCLPTLLSTTHQLTPLKRHILDAVDATSGITDQDGTTVQDVRDWLDDNDIPHPQEQTLRNEMKELAENYYLHRWEAAGGKNGRADVYQLRDEGALQTPNVYDLGQQAKRQDGIELPADDVVDIDPEDPFEDCHDPIRDQPFTETVSQFEAEFSGSDSEPTTDAADYMGGDPHSDETDETASDSDDSGQASLGAVTDDGVDTDEIGSGASGDVELDPEGEPATPTEQYVFENLNTGQPFGRRDDVLNFLGVVGQGGHETDVDTTGTILDPEHDLWDRPDLTDDRVINEMDAKRELDEAYNELKAKNLVAEVEERGPPAMFEVCVADL